METALIDTFTVPAESLEVFLEQAHQAQSFIKTLPGFVEGFVYAQRDAGEHKRQIVTVAVWETAAAFEHARQAVGARDQQQGINRKEILNKLGIEVARVIYDRSPY